MLSEMDRAPLIRVQVDQEVFVDTVRAGDQLEDATVATEVTSFDHVGDAYVLEGAIVFAGYVKHPNSLSSDTGETTRSSESWSDLQEENVRHIHHRMPFFLRVPVKSQSRGLVNVASRIARWNLHVLEAGWMRVSADLNIVGLNGQQGYHFQCGAQEDGDVLFGNDATADALVRAQDMEDPLELLMRGSPSQEDDLDGLREEQVSAASGGVGENIRLEEVETLSDARGGQPVGTPEHAPQSRESVPAKENEDSHPQELTATQQLANFDRVFSGDDAASPHSGPIEVTEMEAKSAFPEIPPSSPTTEEPTWAEFEFEHQVNLNEAQNVPSEGVRHQEEQFVPSRSFSAEGFHAASGFVSSNGVAPVEEVGQNRGLHLDPSFAYEYAQESAGKADGASDDLNRGEKNSAKETLWSFVDFNAPERSHTLRYIVVQEEETLELLAERAECAKVELIKINHLTSETVVAGEILLAPSYARSK